MEERDFAREYGNRCRQIRQAKGISQQNLADKMNTTPQNISKWERDGISNVNTVMQLSRILGQDITSDQIDQEGVVGEVGQEILSILIHAKGFEKYNDLSQNLYGMSDERVSTELFKLERIGTLVREQFINYDGNEIDGVFITAKGIITAKNKKTFGFLDNVLDNCISYEARIKEERNIQELVEKDRLSQLIWQIPEGGSYRKDYVLNLKQNWRYSISKEMNERDISNSVLDYEVLITGESCFHDILYRMALGLENIFYDEKLALEQFYDDDILNEYDYDYYCEKRSLMEDIIEMDYETQNAQIVFDKELFWLQNSDLNMTIKKEDLTEEKKEKLERIAEITAEENIYNLECMDFESRFRERVGDENWNNCSKWFTKEQVEKFIDETYHKASNEREKRIDSILTEINEIEPETLNYYYRFPKEWEENGLAKKIREIYGIKDPGEKSYYQYSRV